MEWYLRALRWTVKHRVITLVAGFVFFVLSVVGLAMVPQTFVPDSDNSSSAITVELPPGVLLSQTAQASNAAYQILRRHPEVKSVVESIGEDEDGEVRSGNIYVQLVPRNQRKLSQKQFESEVTKELRVIPDALELQEPGRWRWTRSTLFVVGAIPNGAAHGAYRHRADAPSRNCGIRVSTATWRRSS
jgi:multidrug efflux pump subunit AcrB